MRYTKQQLLNAIEELVPEYYDSFLNRTFDLPQALSKGAERIFVYELDKQEELSDHCERIRSALKDLREEGQLDCEVS